MNTPYLLNPAHQSDMKAVPFASFRGQRWEHTVRALPFVPTRILNMGKQQGYPVFAYTGLRMMPSRSGEAYPLNASSVIIAMDGCMFSSPNAIAAMLSSPTGQDHVEVSYYQEGERDRPIRRAYIPLYTRTSVSTEWTQLTRSSNIFDPDYTGQIAAAVVILGLAQLYLSFSQSATGQRMTREYQECVRRAEPMIIC